MESSINDHKKPEGFQVHQGRGGNSSGEPLTYVTTDGPFPFVHRDGKLEWKYYNACLMCNSMMGSFFRCGNCLRTFHPACVGLESFPVGNWTCLKCCKDEVFEPKTDLVSEEKKLDD